MRGLCGNLLVCSADQLEEARQIVRIAVEDADFDRQPMTIMGMCYHPTLTVEDARTANEDSDMGGFGKRVGPGAATSEDSLVPGRSEEKSQSKGKRKRNDDWQQKHCLAALGLQAPLLIGPLRDFPNSMVGDIVDRFGKDVVCAEVMVGERSQSERRSLMLWVSRHVSVRTVGDEGWPLTIRDPRGICTVVEGLKDIVPSATEQTGTPVRVQQATKHFVPGPLAFRPRASKWMGRCGG